MIGGSGMQAGLGRGPMMSNPMQGNGFNRGPSPFGMQRPGMMNRPAPPQNTMGPGSPFGEQPRTGGVGYQNAPTPTDGGIGSIQNQPQTFGANPALGTPFGNQNGPMAVDTGTFNPAAGQWGQYGNPQAGTPFAQTQNGMNYMNGQLWAPEGLSQGGPAFQNFVNHYQPMWQQQQNMGMGGGFNSGSNLGRIPFLWR